MLKLKGRKDFMLEVLFYFVLLLQKWGLNPGSHGCQASISSPQLLFLTTQIAQPWGEK